VLTAEERKQLLEVADKLDRAREKLHGDLTTGRVELNDHFAGIEQELEDVVGVSPNKQEGTIRDGSIVSRQKRLVPGKGDDFYRMDPQAAAVRKRVELVREQSHHTFRAVYDKVTAAAKPDVAAGKEELGRLRDEVRLLAGAGELPARNVGPLGVVLYTEHLLAVEMAGTLLLVATIGAVAIAHRKGGPR
jgi:hypothetical protein